MGSMKGKQAKIDAAFGRLADMMPSGNLLAGTDPQEMQMGEMTSIYGRNNGEDTTDVTLNIWTQNGESKFATTGHETILGALEHKPATEVHLRGKKVFERRDGGWYFTGD